MHRSCTVSGNGAGPLSSTKHRLYDVKRFSVLPMSRRRTVVVAAETQRNFNEGAAQVRRLLDRDRRELMGEEEIGQSLKTEFDEEPGSSTDAAEGSASVSSNIDTMQEATRTFPTGQERGAPKPAVNPFGAAKAPAGPANPFGFSSTPRPFIEPSGMSPDMEQYPLSTVPWWKQITITQVVIALSFTLIISLMLGTFFVVWKSGAIRLNE